jgi:hypothetical protein
VWAWSDFAICHSKKNPVCFFVAKKSFEQERARASTGAATDKRMAAEVTRVCRFCEGGPVGDEALLPSVADHRDDGSDEEVGAAVAGGGSLSVLAMMDNCINSLEAVAHRLPHLQRATIVGVLHNSHPGIALGRSSMAAIATAAARGDGGDMSAGVAALLLAVMANQAHCHALAGRFTF